MSNIKLWPGWHIVREIGSGSYGKVFEIHRTSGTHLERAALKVIHIPPGPADLEQLHMEGIGEKDTERYLRQQVDEILDEIGIMQRLVGYSNIVSYEDYLIQEHEFEIGWDILIRMELLQPLTEYMSSNPMSEEDVVRLGMDISQALTICHGVGIIHRDIKPQNIFVNSEGFFKLGDFGISRTMPRTGSMSSFKGTISYMAPETFSMKNTDVRSDIYMLALVLYRILNGGREAFLSSPGFSPSEQEEARRRRLRGEPVPRPIDCSSGLWKVLSRALSADPSDRYQTAKAFHNALHRLTTEKHFDYDDYDQEKTLKLQSTLNNVSDVDEQVVKDVPRYNENENTQRTTKNKQKKANGILEGLLLALVAVFLVAVLVFLLEDSSHTTDIASEHRSEAQEKQDEDEKQDESKGQENQEKQLKQDQKDELENHAEEALSAEGVDEIAPLVSTENSEENESENPSTTVLETGSIYEIESKMILYEAPSTHSKKITELEPGWALIVEEAAPEGNGWHYVSLGLNAVPTYGYIRIP